MLWGFPWYVWGLWATAVLAVALVGFAWTAWGADGRRVPPPLPRRPLPQPPKHVPTHARWIREGETTDLRAVMRDSARAGVFPNPPFRSAAQGDEDKWGPWPGDRS